MKFTLTLYICSLVANQCYIPADYPIVKENYYNCVRDGLGESFEYLFSTDNFTEELITNSKIYASYTCIPTVKEKV